MTIRNYTNAAPPVQFASDVTAGAALWPVTSTTGYPDPPFTLAAERGTANEEFVLVITKTTDSFTVDRGYDDTSPAAHVAGTSIEHCSGAIDFREANAHVNDITSHTTICTSATRPTVPTVGQRIYETDTGRYYTFTGLGSSVAAGWLPDAGTLLDHQYWAGPTSMEYSTNPGEIGHDLPLHSQFFMPALPEPIPHIHPPTTPGTGVYYRRLKIEFFCESFNFDNGAADDLVVARIMPSTPSIQSGLFGRANVIGESTYSPGYNAFIYAVTYPDNQRIPPGPAGCKVQFYSPTGRTGAIGQLDAPIWLAVSVV